MEKSEKKMCKKAQTGMIMVPEELGKRSGGTPSVPRRESGPGEGSAQPSSQSPRSPTHKKVIFLL